jgi:hypothetical protein
MPNGPDLVGYLYVLAECAAQVVAGDIGPCEVGSSMRSKLGLARAATLAAATEWIAEGATAGMDLADVEYDLEDVVEQADEDVMADNKKQAAKESQAASATTPACKNAAKSPLRRPASKKRRK